MKKIILLLLIAMCVPFVSANLMDGLQAYYTLDQTSGTNAVDYFGVHNGTANNARVFTSAVTGIINTGADFTQGSDFINLNNAFQGNEFSYSLWFYANSYGGGNFGRLMSGENSGEGAGTIFHITSENSIVFSSIGGTVLTSTNNHYNVNEWVHVVVTRNNSNAKIYINGTERASSTSFTYNAGTSSLYLGRNRQNELRDFDGFIDEVGIWDRALSASEIEDLYNAQKDGIASIGQPPFSAFFSIRANNGAIQNLSATVITAQNGTQMFSTTNGTITTDINITLGYIANITVSASGFLPKTFTNWNTSQSLNANLVANNIIRFNFKDERNGNTINNVTGYLFESNTQSVINFNTTTGTHLFSEVPTGSYVINYNSQNYEPNTFSFVIPTDSEAQNNVTLYMLNSSVAQSVVFITRDANTEQIIPNVRLSILRVVGNNLTIISVKETDLTGRTQFSYEENIPYYFLAFKEEYEIKEFNLNPIIFTSYDVLLNKIASINLTQDFSEIGFVLISPKTFQQNTNNNITAAFVSGTGLLQSFNLSATYKTNTSSISGNNAFGGILNTNLTIGSVEFGDRVLLEYCYTTSQSVSKCFMLEYPLLDFTPGAGTLSSLGDSTFGMGLIERILIVVIIVVVAGGLILAVSSVEAGAFAAVVIFGYFTYSGFIPLWASLPSILLIITFVGASKI